MTNALTINQNNQCIAESKKIDYLDKAINTPKELDLVFQRNSLIDKCIELEKSLLDMDEKNKSLTEPYVDFQTKILVQELKTLQSENESLKKTIELLQTDKATLEEEMERVCIKSLVSCLCCYPALSEPIQSSPHEWKNAQQHHRKFKNNPRTCEVLCSNRFDVLSVDESEDEGGHKGTKNCNTYKFENTQGNENSFQSIQSPSSINQTPHSHSQTNDDNAWKIKMTKSISYLKLKIDHMCEILETSLCRGQKTADDLFEEEQLQKQVYDLSHLPLENKDLLIKFEEDLSSKRTNNFLNDFIDEAESLLIKGYSEDNSEPIKVKIVSLVCDAPAKSFVLKTKGHTGYYSCSRCTHKGKAFGSRIYFPEIDYPLRTHDSIVKKNQPEYHQGYTDLIRLPNFDVIKCIPMDYMHLICLGVVRKLLTMWLFLKKGPQRLSKNVCDQISCNLCSLSKYIPHEFARKPRALSEANRWKATELRMFLLYTGPVVLKDYLSNSLYLKFLTFSIATYIMLSREYHLQYLDFADALLKWFVKDFSLIYGKQFISHNVHGLINLKEDVQKYGPLDECSAFRFENYMHTIKKMLARKPEKPLQQFARRYNEISSNLETAPKEPSSNTLLKHCHSDGPLLSNVHCFEYKELSLQNFILTTSIGNNCCKLIDGSIVLVYNIVKDSEDINIIGKKFTEQSNFFDQPCKSSDLGIFYVNTLSSLKSWPIKEITLKYILLPYSNGFVVYPLIHL